MKSIVAIALVIIFYTTGAQSKAQEVNLGQMRIDHLSVEGTHRAVAVLRGETTPLLRMDCGEKVELVVDSKAPIGSKPHQLFRGNTVEFYCQATSRGLFGGLVIGDTVNVKLITEVTQSPTRRGRIESVAVKDIIVSVIKSKNPLEPLLQPPVRFYSKDTNLGQGVDLHSSEYMDLDVTTLETE